MEDQSHLTLGKKKNEPSTMGEEEKQTNKTKHTQKIVREK